MKYETWQEYLEALEREFETAEDPARAVQMSKYMRDQFEYYGFSSGERRKLSAPFLRKKDVPPKKYLWKIVKWCWAHPKREMQYFAMELCAKYTDKAETDDIDLYEWMITHKSWWDTVDYIAANLAGPWFRKFPEHKADITDSWVRDLNMWLQRSALIFQLKYRNSTDFDLLKRHIDKLKSENEFFIQKAIGWSLRQYSKTNPDAVAGFVKSQKLSGLATREASKYI